MIDDNESQLIVDEYGQFWKIFPEDGEFYQQVKELIDAKSSDDPDPVTIPFSEIQKHQGFGWWTVFEEQKRFVDELEIPPPDPTMIPSAEVALLELAKALQTFGGYTAYLESMAGMYRGRVQALKETYDTAIMVRLDLKAKGTEKSKEAAVLRDNATLRETRRRQIIEEARLSALKGLLDAYRTAFETTSRLLTLRQLESQLATTRHL